MKRFVFSVLAVSVFFLGVGALVERTGAKFKSDEKALDLVRKARVAIGGDAAINAVQSMTIVGRTTVFTKIDGEARSESGETEIAFQFPDRMSRSVRIGKDDGTGAKHEIVSRQVDVVVVKDTADGNKSIGRGEGRGVGVGIESGHRRVMIKKDDGTVQELTGVELDKWIAEHPDAKREKHVMIKKADGTTEEIGSQMKEKIARADGGTKTWTTADGKTFTVALDDKMKRAGEEAHMGKIRHNDMLRLSLGLLLTSPKGMDVEYTYGGEANLDGTACNIVVASFGGQSFKLYLDQSSNLPVGMAYRAVKMPMMVAFHKEAAPPADGGKDVMLFKKAGGAHGEMADFQVRFSDYRSVGGVQLPFKWTQTVGGAADETFDVTSYEINPANIAEKFQNQKVMVRTKKPDGQ